MWRHLVSSFFVCIIEINPPFRLPAQLVRTLLLFFYLPGWSFSLWSPVCRDPPQSNDPPATRPHVPTPAHRRAHLFFSRKGKSRRFWNEFVEHLIRVEFQGRGTLHLHMAHWALPLKEAPGREEGGRGETGTAMTDLRKPTCADLWTPKSFISRFRNPKPASGLPHEPDDPSQRDLFPSDVPPPGVQRER